MATYTISYSERNKGWTSFWSYIPDWFSRLNNRFYTIKNGQLWLHNDEENEFRNNFYGTQHGSSIKTVFNNLMAEDKIYKNLVLESDHKWDILIVTNLTESTIAASEFNTRESRQFSFIRGNEGSTLRGNAAQGIGVISTVNTLNVVFDMLPDLISAGDVLYQLNGENQVELGVIQNINFTTNTITLVSAVNTPQAGLYAFAKKNERAEGEEVRGYHAEVTLSNSDTEDVELFGVATNVIKSYV